MNYKKEVQTLDKQIFSKMRLCSYSLQCKEFGIAFVPSKKYELYTLYKDKKSLSAYFPIPNATKNSLKMYLPKAKYLSKVKKLQKEILLNFLLVLLVITILSFVFAIYVLFPLRNALRLTEEFIKDILHDFNTPLATLRLNIAMLKCDDTQNNKIKRIENSVENILNLQENLRSYLNATSLQIEEFSLKALLNDRVTFMQGNYQNISFSVNVEDVTLKTNQAVFTRIIDNLLTNAAKYNKPDGKVMLCLNGIVLEIADTGKGIKNPSKVFDRFYKEQERGIGIGLHIVQKFCNELEIKISLESKLMQGTTFKLNLERIFA
ncbi:sensor histidine kinase [Sulfurimonas sp.]